jgi:endonuclease-8
LRAARTLHRVFAGQTVERASSSRAQVPVESLVGARIERVEARGKNMLMSFDDGRVLYTHMRMHGSWHIYRPGERWQKPAGMARIALYTQKAVAVCFNAPVVELLRPAEVAHHPMLANLGPDLLTDDFDAQQALRRMREMPAMPLGEAVLAQAVVAGIGNIYKSESLFLCGADPFAEVSKFTDAQLLAALRKARELMRRNLEGHPRMTRSSLDGTGRYWVYRRSGKPCRRCETKIAMRRQGPAARSTYYCPTCQPSLDVTPAQNTALP